MPEFEKKILKVLNQIDKGEIQLDEEQVKYAKENFADCPFNVGKFIITIFNDCGEWDYVSEVQYGGKKITNYLITKHMPKLYNWQPTHPEYWGMEPGNE